MTKPLVVTRYGDILNPNDPKLSSRESETLVYFLQGYKQAVIAAKMKICLGTVKIHLSSARKKLGVRS